MLIRFIELESYDLTNVENTTAATTAATTLEYLPSLGL